MHFKTDRHIKKNWNEKMKCICGVVFAILNFCNFLSFLFWEGSYRMAVTKAKSRNWDFFCSFLLWGPINDFSPPFTLINPESIFLSFLPFHFFSSFLFFNSSMTPFWCFFARFVVWFFINKSQQKSTRHGCKISLNKPVHTVWRHTLALPIVRIKVSVTKY